MTTDQKMVIRGAGGGKEGGGARTPTESPNTTRSKQVARVVMLLGEGEWDKVLTKGFQSLYFDGTPVQNADGTYNFENIVVETRNGTNAQTHMQGFEFAESEKPVGIRVRKDVPITKTIQNTDVDAVRVTMAFPRLTFQSTETADLGGAKVELKIAVQNDGGGFVEQILGKIYNPAFFTSAGKMVVNSDRVILDVVWVGELNFTDIESVYGVDNTQVADTSLQNESVNLEYRLVGSSSWIVLKNIAFEGKATSQKISADGLNQVINAAPPVERISEQIDLNYGMYEFRVIQLNGVGSAVIENGAVQVDDETAVIDEKVVARYQRSYEIALPKPGPWDIRVIRLTDDSTISNLQNESHWSSFTEIIDAKFSYPNSVLLGVQIDAEQFSSIPQISSENRMLIHEVPSNYDPVTREYDGVWDGLFKRAWTDNPAWTFRTILLDPRFGLGEFIDMDSVDKWQLYTIAQYCDELVPDGFGGYEPRFTANMYLQTQEEAYTVVRTLASVFAGITYWSAGSIFTNQDSPSDSIALFTHANVIDGEFTYSGASAKVRHTVALVTYIDNDLGNAAVEYVEDREGITKFGYIETKVVAFACSSRGQAHRFGRRILYTERLQGETVSYRVGLDGLFIYPGAVVDIADRNRSGGEFGGRVVSSTATTVTLDRPVVLTGDDSIRCVMPNGTLNKSSVTAGTGNTVNATFSTLPQDGAMWVLSNAVKPLKWQVLSLTENEGALEVVALEYSDLKFDSIEGDLFLEDRETSLIGAANPIKPFGENVVESLFLAGPGIINNRGTLSWQGAADRFFVKWIDPSGQLNEVITGEVSIDIVPMQIGLHKFSIQGVNKVGRKSAIYRFEYNALGKLAPPKAVQNFRFNYVDGQALLSFDRSVDLDVITGGYIEIRHSPINTDWNSAIKIAEGTGGSTSLITIAKAGNYLAKWFDASKKESDDVTIISTGLSFDPNENVVVNHSMSFDVLDHMAVTDALYLDSALTIGEWPDLVSDIPLISLMGGLALEGSAEDESHIDLGAVLECRLVGSIDAVFYNADDLISTRGLVSEWLSVSGSVVSGASVQLFVSTTNDDPNASPTWSDWVAFTSGVYAARGFKFKYVVTSNGVVNVKTNSVDIVIDVPDKINSGDDLASGLGVKSITFSDPFYAKPAVAITAQDMNTGDYFKVTNITKEGFDIRFKDSSAADISRTFDFIARGY